MRSAPLGRLGREPRPGRPISSEEDLAAISLAHQAERHARREALEHLREALALVTKLDAFALLALPEEYIDYLKQTKPLDAARR